MDYDKTLRDEDDIVNLFDEVKKQIEEYWKDGKEVDIEIKLLPWGGEE
jgi:benzoyl-CoA reductase/2-hydroxyglutaryl-CoA dehydratase subunit BcrC/BadD/HgdB